jgi:hypothetical protein
MLDEELDDADARRLGRALRRTERLIKRQLTALAP